MSSPDMQPCDDLGAGGQPPNTPARDATGNAMHALGSQEPQRPVFGRTSLSEQLSRNGFDAETVHSRFEIESMLGSGSGGCVYAARDTDLDRPVAIKVLIAGTHADQSAVRSFIEEARITASLDHPNVLPVHEIEMDENRQVFFTMKRLVGRSLAHVIEASSPAQRAPPLDDTNAVVTMFIGVCQAIALAHRRSIVHQDIKPDNILLGEFGEVLVCDWGSALRLDRTTPQQLYGSPLYMSPEQARRERVDQRSDVYCIGATLFHALMLRPPLWLDDSDAFWAAKRRGALDAPAPSERATTPAALLAITMKALDANPEGRYADAGLLLADLRAFQAGLSVIAAPDTLPMRLRRWHRRHARVLWGWSLSAVLVLVVVALVWGERIEEMAHWGAPVVVLDPDRVDWAQQWRCYEGAFVSREHSLISTGLRQSMLLYDQRFDGSVAIEYDGEIMPGSQPCDISAFWARDVVRNADGTILNLVDPFYLKVGAWDNNYTSIANGQNETLSCNPFHPEIGRSYRIRDEIVGNRITLSVDGRILNQWQEPFPFTNGFVGLQAYYPNKRFTNVRIYQRQPPAKVPATAIGDASVGVGSWALAARQYGDVERAHAGTALGNEARFKQGLCWWHEKDWDRAQALWQALPAKPYAVLIKLNRVQHEIDSGQLEAALTEIAPLAEAHDQVIRERAALLWGRLTNQMSGSHDLSGLRLAVELYDRCLRSMTSVDGAAANALIALGRFQEVLKRFPGQHFLCCAALSSQSHWAEIVDRFPDQIAFRNVAAMQSGRWEAIPPLPSSSLWQETLWLRGRAKEDLTLPLLLPSIRCRALASLGRMDEVLAYPKADDDERARALMLLGRSTEAASQCHGRSRVLPLLDLQRFQEARAAAEGDPSLQSECDIAAAVHALAVGERENARRLLGLFPVDPNAAPILGWDQEEAVVVPWLEDCSGLTTGAMTREMARLHDTSADQCRVAFAIRYVLGEVTEAGFNLQPCTYGISARRLLYGAIRAQRRGDDAEESADERAWLAMPRWQRNENGWTVIEAIVACRLQQHETTSVPKGPQPLRP